MKKGILLGIAGALGLFFALKGTAGAAVGRPPPCGDMGDVDGDGRVTAADAELVAGWLVGNVQLTQDQLRRAAVRGNATVDIFDAMFIAQYVEGVRDTFPVCV